jgi:hypothetical protein
MRSSSISLNEVTTTNVIKYDSATMIPKGRLARELVLVLGLGVAINWSGETKLTMLSCQSVVYAGRDSIGTCPHD